MFKVVSDFEPIEEQKKAVAQLSDGVLAGLKNQALLGVTGSGKTFTVAHTIQKLQLPTLIISHNKTLAGQLYQEMRQFFPGNAVSYFVSYYDYYQPEAYIPQTDTYIEKEAQINQLIDKLRLATTTNILTRNDVIVVASVSCIYNIGSPREYGRFILELKKGEAINRKQMFIRLAQLQYERSEFDFKRGTFRERGGQIDIYPAYEDMGYHIKLSQERIADIISFDPRSGETIADHNPIGALIIYPAKHYMMDEAAFEAAEAQIRGDLELESKLLAKSGRGFEAQRLIKKVSYDLEMIKEMGYVNGIENYSRYFDGRGIGDPPYTLLDYFEERYDDRWLVCIDESHMTVPQVRGMYNGDRARKQTLIEYGFRLKAALDNRPLKFDEFYRKAPHLLYVSATPGQWELAEAKDEGLKAKGKTTAIVEQLVRPTGIVDPQITIRPSEGEIPDLICEIEKRVAKNQRVLVTTLTKRIAEDLTTYLKEKKIKAEYLHSDIKTLARADVLAALRRRDCDVLVGINLLREGLDLPEVALVAILDADKEGFLRSKTSLIQTMGRAARHVEGEVIIYADKITKSIYGALAEVKRRREYQLAYNKKHSIKPRSVSKPLRENIISEEPPEQMLLPGDASLAYLDGLNITSLTPYDKKKWVGRLKRLMRQAAENLQFEEAIAIREKMRELC